MACKYIIDWINIEINKKEVEEMCDNEIERAERNYKRLLSDTDVNCSGERERRREERNNASETSAMRNGETERNETILNRNGAII